MIRDELSNLGIYRVTLCFPGHPWVLLWKESKNGAEKGVSGHFHKTRVAQSVYETVYMQPFQKSSRSNTRVCTRVGQAVLQTV